MGGYQRTAARAVDEQYEVNTLCFLILVTERGNSLEDLRGGIMPPLCAEGFHIHRPHASSVDR